MADKTQNSISPELASKDTSMSSRELHDRWLEQRPEGASHPEDCPFCLEAKANLTGGAGDPMSDKTYSESEVQAQIALATKALEDQIRDLEAKDLEAETEAKVAEATVALQAELDAAKAELDVKVAELAGANQKIEDIDAYLSAEKAEKEEAEAAEARKTERVEKVKENASFTDEYVAEHAERWAKMSDEDFEGLIDNLKASGSKGEKAKDDTIPGDTKLAGTSETASKDESKSTLGTILDLRRANIDARRL